MFLQEISKNNTEENVHFKVTIFVNNKDLISLNLIFLLLLGPNIKSKHLHLVSLPTKVELTPSRKYKIWYRPLLVRAKCMQPGFGPSEVRATSRTS